MTRNQAGLWEPETGIEAYEKLPKSLRGGVRRYIEEGTIPGGFLVTVICNDLVGAVSRADGGNILELRQIALWLYNEAPAPCYGSKEKMEAWSKARKEERNTDPA